MPHKTEDGRWALYFDEFCEWNDKRPEQLGAFLGWNCPYCWSNWEELDECKNCGAKRHERK